MISISNKKIVILCSSRMVQLCDNCGKLVFSGNTLQTPGGEDQCLYCEAAVIVDVFVIVRIIIWTMRSCWAAVSIRRNIEPT